MTHRFYADENFPLQAVQALRQWGHDVLTVKESGHAGKAVTDPEILAFASAQQRAVLTHNRRDFIQLHQRTPRHGGIVVCTFDADFERLAKRIHKNP